jgi:chromate transporter
VFWPKGTASDPFQAPLDWFAILLAGAAFIALWKYKIDVMYVIAVSAVLGLSYFLLVL